jgi:hypothetical protein
LRFTTCTTTCERRSVIPAFSATSRSSGAAKSIGSTTASTLHQTPPRCVSVVHSTSRGNDAEVAKAQRA